MISNKYLLIGCLILFLFGCSTENSVKQTVEVGAVINVDSGSEETYVAYDEMSLINFVQVVSDKNEDGLNSMILGGKIFSVKSKTKAKVLKTGITTKVEFIEGKNIGRQVWVDTSWAKPIN